MTASTPDRSWLDEFRELEVFDQLPLSFWMCLGRADDFRIVVWNTRAEEIYGYSKEEALGESFLRLFVTEPARVQAAIDADAVINAAYVHPLNCIAIDEHKAGHEIALLTNVFRYEHAGIGYQAEAAVDLTPSGFLDLIDTGYRAKREGPAHQTERTLAAFIRYYRANLRNQLDLWARTFAHEIRSELAVIHGSLSMLEEAYPDLATRREYLQIDRAHRSLYLQSENFMFSQGRVRASETSIATATFTLSDHTVKLIESYSFDAKVRNLVLDFHIDESILDGSIALVGTEEALSSVLRNILSNAIKHADVETSDAEQRIVVTAESTNRHVTFRVSNPGTVDEDLSRVFDPYFKNDTNPAEGLHLGLAIAMQWVEQVGGAIDIRQTRSSTVEAVVDWPRRQEAVS